MLHIEHLSKRYGSFHALRDVSFQAGEGQVFGLLGPNGAGKTTLLRILATLLSPTAGSARVAGYDVRRDAERVRGLIGVVNGGMGLYDRLTGREILRYFGGFYGLSDARTDRRIDELDGLLDLGETLGRRSGDFSTGMKQKIVIARAVLHDPQVLILDEAASGLDVLARRSLLDFVLRYRAPGKLVLYSTHVMAEVEEVADRLAIIEGGELLTVDTVGGLLRSTAQPSLERAFFSLLQDRARQERRAPQSVA
ncbi:ABC transporter ATP-binding protein [Deinococcus peraridilitoris]|uniref:ABC-type Na+ transport system, ATPase component n=1 Tax=Deinococcus peraridilitoris (strain DSM 19664 / LMG 22246 / CIP 109416 / KR-200) TaxID=937777 RepID=K9ZVS0_DEIPD|nr:ATP-binding cassette domain-containing protein [Deinococcus peraridilitoris]AFZ65718.1 ABC-type Na+ transport system, ATPase component [Deinococcus peraridilitoris DSM 19664]